MIHIERILAYLTDHEEAKTKDIAEHLGLSQARTRAILGLMDEVEGVGNTTNRRYHIKKEKTN